MELDCDLSNINNEELLRKMWLESEDINRKKEIRSHLFKLRETRLIDLYTGGDEQFIMSGNTGAGFSKDPLLPSHGDSLADQSFQSLKSKEVRDSISPTRDIKFHSLALNQPSTTGWDVRSSSEVSPDGRAYRSETVATTDGTEKLNGGIAEFKGRNEQSSSASHQGDDKNFIKKAAESSKTHLQEKVVIGDENSGLTETKMSSTQTSSSSKVFSSSSTTEFDDGEPIGQAQPPKFITDSKNRLFEQQKYQQQQQKHLQEEQYRQQQELLKQQAEERHILTSQQQSSTRQEQRNETYNQNRQDTSQNVETQRHYEENKHYVDMDKASPEYQRQVQHLMSQPGEIISNTVEYPKPNVKMITTVKRLPDGTIVKNKRYETEELKPESERLQQRSTTTATNATNQQHNTQHRVEEENLQTRLKNSRERNTTNTRQISPQRHGHDAVDNAENLRYTHLVETHPQHTEDVTNMSSSSTFSTVKKSSQHFSSETTSETVEEIDDRSANKTKTQDFSTHGFPSVKPNKLTQQYASERPHAAQPSDDFKGTQGFPSVQPHKPTQQYPSERPSPTRTTALEHVTQREVIDSNVPNVRTIKTQDGDVIIVSKETQRSVKQKSNSERIIETEVVSDVDAAPQQITHSTTQNHKTEDFSTHGFPSVKPNKLTQQYASERPHGAQPSDDFKGTQGFTSVKDSSTVWDDKLRHDTLNTTHEHSRQTHAREDFSTHGFPSVKQTSPVLDDMPERHGTHTQEHEQYFTAETKRTSSHKTEAERILELVTDKDHPHYARPGEDFSTHGFPSVGDVKKTRDIAPVHITPVRERSISPRHREDYTTHGFPSARSPTRSKPDNSTHGYPAARSPTRTTPDYATHGFPSARDTKPKPRTSSSPQRKVAISTTKATPKSTTKSTTTTTDSSRSISKQQDVDSNHRRFAASLRSSSPVDNNRRDSHDSHHHNHQQRFTPRSSVSSTATSRTFRRDQREGSHESTARSEASRISSGTVTRQTPGKNAGKTVVTTKQTVVKTRNVNGSNDKIDLKPQRTTITKTKSPSPGKTVTTVTTTTTTSTPQHGPKTPATPTKTSPIATPTKQPTPNDAPKTDNQLTKPTADEQIPINHEPLTITKTDFSSNDANLSRNAAIIEEPICQKKHFYQLGPSDDPQNTAITSTIETSHTEHSDAKSPRTYSPTAPNSHSKFHRTSQQHHVIKKDSPEREYEPIRYPSESEFMSQPSNRPSSTDVESNKYVNNIKTDNETRRTVLRETIFGKNERDQNTVEQLASGGDEPEPQYDSDEPSVTSDFEPYKPNAELTKPKPILDETKHENERVEKLFNVNVKTINSTQNDKQNISEKLISTEREHLSRNIDESTDGALISKQPFAAEPTAPTYKKKGLTRRETFEERCKQILGMEDSGDTQGAFKQLHEKTEVQKVPKEKSPKPTSKQDIQFVVTIEDCDDDEDDKPLSINTVRETLINQKKTVKTESAKKETESDLDDVFTENTTIKNKEENIKNKHELRNTTVSSSSAPQHRPNEKSPTRRSPTKEQTPTKRRVGSSPSKYSPERAKSPQKFTGPKQPKSSTKLPELKQTQQTNDIDVQFEIIPKKKSTSPMRKSKSPSPIRESKSPSPMRQSKSPSPTRNAPYINEETTIELKTTEKSELPIPAPKKKPTKKPSLTESDIETESYPESEVDSVKENFFTEKRIECTDKTVSKTAKNLTDETIKTTKAKTPTITKTQRATSPSKTTPKSSPRETAKLLSSSTNTNTTVKTTAKHTISPKNDTPKQKPSLTTKVVETVEETLTTRKKPNDETQNTTSIKERLRSATRRTPSKTKPDQRDGALSTSPESSPTRANERRRSSNISVHTEIIIEHAGLKSPESETPKSKRKQTQPTSPKKPTMKDAPNTLINRKQPVTERKESAPVNRVTRRDDDMKMSRSTSENIIKLNGKTKPDTKKPLEPSSLTPKREARPSKCFTTKTINLTTNEKLVKSDEIENVIIDIQHAKSSREPSPDKIVPTPVPAYLDTGKPRYPDVVQEPEDEPRKKPIIKNIPILEEDTNSYINCHISEVKVDKLKSTIDNTDFNDEILTQPTIEAPISLEYPSIDKPDEECLLSVHEKVSKFINTAEETNKPKTSSPFQPVFEKSPTVPEDDECLLSVDQKVTKFLKTAESITKTPIAQLRDIQPRPNAEELDEEIRNDECTLSVSQKINKFINTAEKLAPSTPQKSPEIVKKIERHLSRQNEPDDEALEDTKLAPFSENHTTELELKRQKDILTRPSVWHSNKPNESKRPNSEICEHKDTDEDELVPMSKTHTTDIELKRQKDILSRPSVFEGRNTPSKSQSPIPTKKSTILERMQRFEATQNTRKTSVEEEEKQITKKSNTNVINDNRKEKTSATTISTTRSRFEAPKTGPKEHHSTPQKPMLNGKAPVSKPAKKSTLPNEKSTSPTRNQYKPADEHPLTDETESEIEFVETEQTVSRKSSTQSTKLKKIETKQAQTKNHIEISHSPTRNNSGSSSRSNSPKKSTNTYTSTIKSKVNESTLKTHPISSPSKTSETVLIESIVESSPKESFPAMQPTQPQHKPRVITESVAARRNIFENTYNKATPTPSDVRRPSYMDHTRSSLEHIRRDSLEVNKTHYARKPSVEDDVQFPARPNSAVKFDVPQKSRKNESISEDINIEEIFDLEILEEMLETVTSYELRRRIRAQIRLVKKNALNTIQTDSKMSSSTMSSMHKSSMQTSTSSSNHHQHHHHEETDHIQHHGEKHAPRKSSPINRVHSPSEKPRERSYSPTERKTVHSSTKEVHHITAPETTSTKHYTHREEYDYAKEHTHQDMQRTRHSPERSQISPERQQSPSLSKPPIKPRDRSHSPDVFKSKPTTTERGSPIPKPRERSQSPPKKPSNIVEEKRNSFTKSTVRTTSSPERKSHKSKPDDKTPIWADRKNILKSPGTQSPVSNRKASSSPMSHTSATKTTKMTMSQRQLKSSEEDCITSSYGIGPTDENGLPLFGIKALKKKSSKPYAELCEPTEEVTGYVIEEQWYSDGTKVPKHERKEFIYSTNEEELKSMKKQIENRKSSKDDVKVTRKFQKIEKDAVIPKETQAITSSGNVEDLTTTKKYVRRGSVKEMSEKFIRKESKQSMSEKSATKSSVYPKAGLILRTSSRKGSLGTDDDGGNLSTMTTTTTTTKKSSAKQQPTTTVEHDNYDDFESAQAHADYEHEHEQQSTTRSFHESESECESLSTKRDFVSKKSSSSMSSSTRSFLNSTGESRVVTDVDDVLERMRNADNVVESGDTAEDQEARALLNKFLGASVIMRGVETGSLVGSPQTKQETKTTTSTSYNDGDKVTTTRVTKTIKTAGSSSTPVTYTTCDIEEIWDEEILKQLLESATTYEERRKIRARLRELMAEREGKNSTKVAEKAETAETATQEEEIEDSSESEYEEIIEEVTDYSDAEEEQNESSLKSSSQTIIKKSSSTKSHDSTKSVEVEETVTDSKRSDKVEETAIEKAETEKKQEITEEQGGELLLPLLQNLLHKSRTPATKQQTANQNSQNTNKTNLSSKPPCKANTNKTTASSGVFSHSSVSSSSNNSASSAVPLKNSKNISEASSTCNTVLSVSNNKKTNSSDNSSLSQQEQVTTTKTATATTKKTKTTITDNMTDKTLATTVTNAKLDRLNVPQRDDSGTESGEDLRLIAAGLRDKLQMQNGDSNLIEEVTAALSRLESSLKEGRDIALDGQKRKALLALVARLQTGLQSPEQLDDVNNTQRNLSNVDGSNECNFDENSSPEFDVRNNRHRFAKRRNRNSRHTVGVSREELADARRYMEDKMMMENISNCTTPDSSCVPTNTTTPQWFPIEKNSSSNAIIYAQTPTQPLFRPNQFMPNNNKNSMDRLTVNQNDVVLRNGNGKHKRRPLSGEVTVSFQEPPHKDFTTDVNEERSNQCASSDSAAKGVRFNMKKQIYKRSNTIDIPKTKKYNPDFDSDSDMEDHGPQLGLKRTVQVSVNKNKLRQVVPPFEPKTENDRKFLAFINKQSPKTGLGWTNSKSLTNWTNKFGSIKHNFEVGAAATATTGKPPQVPGHYSTAMNRKQILQDYTTNSQRQQQFQWQLERQQQQQQQQLQQQQQEAAERQRQRMHRERIERERIQYDRLERKRQEIERQERERAEREYFERERQVAQQQQYSKQQQEQQFLLQQKQQQQQALNQPALVNKFIHAPQSVFKPIESDIQPIHNIYKPIPQNPNKSIPPNTWQPPSVNSMKPSSKSSSIASPQFLTQKPSPYISLPSSAATSPIGLPWLSKPVVNKDFKSKAQRFEEASLRDNREAELAAYSSHGLYRHNSLNTPRVSQHQYDDYKKRPSLPNANDPYQNLQNQFVTSYQDLPPPTNISIKYADYGPSSRVNYKSVPCLPTAVDDSLHSYKRSRQDSLTNPEAMPLVLTSSNPIYNSNADKLQNSYARPTPPKRQYDYARQNIDSDTMAHTDYTDTDDLDSDSNLLEYRAESKVMRKPQGQMAVTVGRRTAHFSDDELYGKNSHAAKNLLSTMRTFSNGQRVKQTEQLPKKPNAAAATTTSPIQRTCLSPDGRSYQAPIVEPLFPEITSFKPNRDPVYVKSNESTLNSRQDVSYRPIQHKPELNTSRKAPMKQAMSYDQEYIDQRRQYQQQQQQISYDQHYFEPFNQQQQTQIQQPPRAPRTAPAPAPVSASAPYVSESPAAYVVTYPLDDPSDIEDYHQAKLHPSSIPLQRQRHISENSTSSSISFSQSTSHNLPSPSNTWSANSVHNNIPSPNTSWTANPVHPANQQSSGIQITDLSTHSSTNFTEEHTYTKQTQQQQSYNHEQYEPPKPVAVNKSQKPDVAAGPSATASTSYQELTQEHYQLPLSTESVRNPKLSARSQTLPNNESNTKSNQQQQSRTSVLQQRTIENSSVKQTSTVQKSIQQQQFEQKQQRNQQQQQQQQQQVTEVRRKSLGQIFDEQEQQRKAALYQTTQQTEIIKREEYKSSAPPDTPDIVKSSLPLDESQPILKKFGPPQRHHYMPNSYQSPIIKTQSSQSRSSETKKSNSGNTTKIVKREVVQHSSITNKPAIVEIPATPQPQDAKTEDQIPRNIVFNNINAFTSMTRRHQEETRTAENTRVNRLSKSDSWNQMCLAQQQAPTPKTNSPKFNTSSNDLRRSKSGNTLAVPKMYEAGMNKEEISEKQRTVAAYFSGKKSPNSNEATTEVMVTKKSTINRVKTSEKVSANRKSLTNNDNNSTSGNVGLVRSATMPAIGNLNLLDESNVEDAFEQLMMAQSADATSTTEKSETKEKDGAIVTTTTKVTTRTVSGGTAPKPVSSINKFKQLDRQSSQQSQKSPSTPTTPGCSTPTTPGSAPFFKFTDPALNARAATVKDQLLQWCQSKTSEYENVQINNFSSSWSDGLAFCALIHHFLPDAFDYTKLTPKSRRHNFELAFTIADEKAGIAPLLDVEDMVIMQRPDWKSVFVYVQSIYRRFRNCQ